MQDHSNATVYIDNSTDINDSSNSFSDKSGSRFEEDSHLPQFYVWKAKKAYQKVVRPRVYPKYLMSLAHTKTAIEPEPAIDTFLKYNLRYPNPLGFDSIGVCTDKDGNLLPLPRDYRTTYNADKVRETENGNDKCPICRYRFTLEKWCTPNLSPIYCPKCFKEEIPLTRHRLKKEKNQNWACSCLMSCWPLCFIPYICGPSAETTLICPECFNFLGIYDEKEDCIRPNTAYLKDRTKCYGSKVKEQDQSSPMNIGEKTIARQLAL